jgi:hypothetical protein
VRTGGLRFPPGMLHSVDLDAGQINPVLDGLETSTDRIRTVISPRE